MPLGGAGAFGAGAGSAGFDPVADPSDTTSSQAPAALFFDPTTRDFRKGDDGRFVATDPVDQEVVLSLWVKLRSIGSSPGTGSGLRDLKRQGGPGFLGQVDSIVRAALKLLTDRNAISIVSINVDTRIRGRTYVIVTYVNNTLKKPGTQPSSVSIGV